MKIKISKTLFEEVNIDDSQMQLIALKVICEVLKFNPEWYIDTKGNLCIDDELHTSHSWTSTDIIRKATTEDMSSIELLKKIRNYKQKV